MILYYKASSFSILTIIVLLCCVANLVSQTTPQALAPILIGPYDGSDVSENNIVWTWFMQPRASNSEEIICDLKVVEVLDGQSTEEALRVNPLVILKEDLTTSAWQTNFAARNFLPGHKYAWRVIAKVRKPTTGQDQIVSESEIWSYTYNIPATDIPIPASDTTTAQPSIVAHAEPEEASRKKAFEFTGRSRVTMEHNDNIGLLTEAPKNLVRWQVEPTLKFFGVPFGLNLLLTTEENTRKADVNRGAFGSQNTNKGLNLVLQQRVEETIAEMEQVRDSAGVDSLRLFVGADSVALANRIQALYELEGKDLSENMETLREMGLLTQEQETLAQFPALGFGKVVPSFSRFFFNGVTINGGLVEYNPGNFYAAAVLGKVQRTVDASIIPSDVLERDSSLLSNVDLFKNIYSARLGYGRRNGNHLLLSIIHADDDDQSIFVQSAVQKPFVDTLRTTLAVPIFTSSGDTLRDPDDTTRIITKDTTILTMSSRQNLSLARQQNTVLGLTSHFALDSMDITLDGEFNVSYFKDEKNKLWSDTNARIGVRSAATLQQIFGASEFEQIDIAYSIRSAWQFMEKTARLTGGLRYVGGGFTSVGVAGLRKDILRADALYSHTLCERQIRINAGYSFEEFGYKRSSIADSLLSTINSVLAGTEIRLRGLPVLSLNYSRHAQAFTLQRDSLAQVLIDSVSTDTTFKFNDKFNNSITQYVVSASHIYGDASLRMSSFISYMSQTGRAERSRNNSTFIRDTLSPNSFTSSTLQLSQRFGFGEYINFGCLGSYTTTYASSSDSSSVWSVDFSALISPFSWLPITAGYIKSRDEINGTSTAGLYITVRAHPTENIDIDLRIDSKEFQRDTFIENSIPNGFTGFTARLTTNIRW